MCCDKLVIQFIQKHLLLDDKFYVLFIFSSLNIYVKKLNNYDNLWKNDHIKLLFERKHTQLNYLNIYERTNILQRR